MPDGLMEMLHGAGLAAAFLIALAAGVASTGVCPCTLPLGAGIAAAAGTSEGGARRAGLGLVAMFAAGIVFTLSVLGVVAGQAGALMTVTFGRWWALAMAILTLVAAIAAFSGLRLKAPQLERFRRPGLVGGFVYGVVFSLGTATAPLLVVLAAAAAQSDPVQGATLGAAFGAGRALPFLLIGMSAGFVSRFLQSPGRRRALQAISGSALLIASLYFGRVFLSFL